MNDNIQEIERILELYYEGVSGPDEERRLAKLFRETSPLPTDLEVEKKVFFAMTGASFVSDEESLETLEALTKRIVESPETSPNPHFVRLSDYLLKWGGVAAAVAAIVLCAFWYHGQYDRYDRDNEIMAYYKMDPTKARIITDDKAKILYTESILNDIALQLEMASNEMVTTESIIIDDTETILNVLE